MEYYVFTKKRDETKGWMDNCIVWWRPEGKGYTYDLNYAGVFTEEHIAKRYPPPDICQYVPKDLVDGQTYSPRLAFWSEGRHGETCVMDLLGNESPNPSVLVRTPVEAKPSCS